LPPPDQDASSRASRRRPGYAAVVFDLDGTLLDSARGIVAGFQRALGSVGFDPPDVAILRSDLGPPVDVLFASFGLPADRMDEAVASYRSFYLGEGLAMSSPYPGIVSALTALTDAGVQLAVATAKRTDLARAILEHHRLAPFFGWIGGADQPGMTKDATLADTLRQLGSPRSAVMVGDRHSDIAAAHTCGVGALGVSWGYGSRAELIEAGAAMIIDAPSALVGLGRSGIYAR